jgi:DNA mismatch repair ATPase MutS
LHSIIADREIELTQQLQQDVLESEEILVSIADDLAELDCILAFAHGINILFYFQSCCSEQLCSS